MGWILSFLKNLFSIFVSFYSFHYFKQKTTSTSTREKKMIFTKCNVFKNWKMLCRAPSRFVSNTMVFIIWNWYVSLYLAANNPYFHFSASNFLYYLFKSVFCFNSSYFFALYSIHIFFLSYYFSYSMSERKGKICF